jgi:electron transfer flavoprotein alpha subunit
MAGRSVLVYSEDRELAYQLLAKGRELADKLGAELCAVEIGSGVTDADGFVRHGADKVYVVDDRDLAQFNVETYRSAVMRVMEAASPEILLMGATKRGKELAARVAAALETGCMTECIKLDVDDDGRLLAERLTYGGSTIASQASNRRPHVATVPARVFKKLEPSPRKGDVINLDVDVPESRVKVVERREKARGDTGLVDAPVIVSAGRGFREKEDLRLLEELADVLGAKMGCTRPIAADLGWMEEWVGISGFKVAPRLYVACGISGTIQHAAGIRDSRIIVSVNSQEGANIQEISDYSVVGDLYKVLPALTRVLRERLK